MCAPGMMRKKLSYFVTLSLPAFVYLFLTLSYGICDPINSQSVGLSIAMIAGVIFTFTLATGLIMFIGSRGMEAAVDWARELLLGVHLISLGGASLLSIMLFEQHAVRMILWLIIVVSINDTSAYLVGSKVGGPRFAPVISPNKTISGSAAGIICGTAAGLLFWFLLPLQSSSYFAALIVTLLTVVVAQIGDLSKSYVKRLHAVKDSGNLLPGHGGILDRVDGILAAAPVLLLSYLLHALL